MPGITRIKIVSDWYDWRHELSDSMIERANEIYRHEFANLNMPLAEGEETIQCSPEQAEARYDWKEGIDVILTTEDGQRFTLQEKFLTFPAKSTVTYEERKGNGRRGAWYYCTAQYYFVGYVRGWDDGNREFDDWVLLDNAAVHRADAQGLIEWFGNGNRRDGRRALFRYAYFGELPEICIVAKNFETDRIQRVYLIHEGEKVYFSNDTPLQDFLDDIAA